MRLLVLTACEKVIQDPLSGPSLIATFQELTVAFQGNQEVPLNAVVPKDWVVFAQWLLEEEDRGKNFILHVDVYWPDGTVFTKQQVDVTSTLPDWMNLIARMLGFPAGQSGKITISVSVEFNGATVSGPIETFVEVKVKRNEQQDGS
jgi:hypothetical protein